MSGKPEEFTGRIIFMSMFNDISWGSKDDEQECELSAKFISFCARRFPTGILPMIGNHKENGTESRNG